MHYLQHKESPPPSIRLSPFAMPAHLLILTTRIYNQDQLKLILTICIFIVYDFYRVFNFKVLDSFAEIIRASLRCFNQIKIKLSEKGKQVFDTARRAYKGNINISRVFRFIDNSTVS